MPGEKKDASVNCTCFVLPPFAKALPFHHTLRIIPISDRNFSSSTKGASRSRKDSAVSPAPLTLPSSSEFPHFHTAEILFLKCLFIYLSVADPALAFQLVRLRFTPSPSTALGPHGVGGRGYGVGNNQRDCRRSRLSPPLSRRLLPHLVSVGETPQRRAQRSQAASRRAPPPPARGSPLAEGTRASQPRPAAGLAPRHGARSGPLIASGADGTGRAGLTCQEALGSELHHRPGPGEGGGEPGGQRLPPPRSSRGPSNSAALATERPASFRGPPPAQLVWLRAVLINTTGSCYWFSCLFPPTERPVIQTRPSAPSGSRGGGRTLSRWRRGVTRPTGWFPPSN